jgi:hypothetical protein
MIVQPEIAYYSFTTLPPRLRGYLMPSWRFLIFTKDVSTQSYLSLVQSSPDQLAGTRYALQLFFSL